MIWNYIRDFFVQYIFGGYTSGGNFYSGLIANINGYEVYTDDLGFKFDTYYYGDGIELNTISIGDWLSTTATIICMVLISICFILLVRWLFKAVASAFLLK